MEGLFRVVWTSTGEQLTYKDLEEIALKEHWAKGLVYCDIEGFYIGEDGTLILADECGNFRYPPEDLFRVEWNNIK